MHDAGVLKAVQEIDEELARRRREYDARVYPKALAMMTTRMERRIQPLRRALVARLNLGEELSEAVIAAAVHTWWRKLYPEERRFLERYYGEVQSWLEKALMRKGPR